MISEEEKCGMTFYLYKLTLVSFLINGYHNP